MKAYLVHLKDDPELEAVYWAEHPQEARYMAAKDLAEWSFPEKASDVYIRLTARRAPDFDHLYEGRRQGWSSERCHYTIADVSA